MRALPLALTLATLLAAPALAQAPADPAPPAAPVAGPQDTETLKQVIVYGDDPCPQSTGDEIVVCARMPDNERYRIPPELRTDPNSPAVQSWVNRARTLEYVGLSGTDSCSITERRTAHSPASGWTTPASPGRCRASRGRATSSVTRPPASASWPAASRSGRS